MNALARWLATLVISAIAFAQTPVTVTYYNPVPWQTDSTPDVAACGPLAEAPRWPGEYLLALSRDLFSRDLCGQHVLIRLDNGEVVFGVVWDTMHPRFERYVDILMPTGKRWVYGKATGKLFLDWNGGG